MINEKLLVTREYPDSVASVLSSVENAILILRQASTDTTLPDDLRFNFQYLAFVIKLYLKDIFRHLDRGDT